MAGPARLTLHGSSHCIPQCTIQSTVQGTCQRLAHHPAQRSAGNSPYQRSHRNEPQCPQPSVHRSITRRPKQNRHRSATRNFPRVPLLRREVHGQVLALNHPDIRPIHILDIRPKGVARGLPPGLPRGGPGVGWEVESMLCPILRPEILPLILSHRLPLSVLQDVAKDVGEDLDGNGLRHWTVDNFQRPKHHGYGSLTQGGDSGSVHRFIAPGADVGVQDSGEPATEIAGDHADVGTPRVSVVTCSADGRSSSEEIRAHRSPRLASCTTSVQYRRLREDVIPRSGATRNLVRRRGRACPSLSKGSRFLAACGFATVGTNGMTVGRAL